MKRRMSHGQATRSTLRRGRVIHLLRWNVTVVTARGKSIEVAVEERLPAPGLERRHLEVPTGVEVQRLLGRSERVEERERGLAVDELVVGLHGELDRDRDPASGVGQQA